MNRVEIREKLEERFGSMGWRTLSWSAGFVLIKDMQTVDGDVVCMYFSETGHCGVVQDFGSDTYSSYVNADYVITSEAVYEQLKKDEDFFFRILKWDENSCEILELDKSFLEEEFGDKKSDLINDFKECMLIMKGNCSSR